MIAMGFKAILSCVEGKVGPGFAGRAYDERLLEDLPAGIDPCGEIRRVSFVRVRRPVFRQARGGAGRRDRHPRRAILRGPVCSAESAAPASLRRRRHSAGVSDPG